MFDPIYLRVNQKALQIESFEFPLTNNNQSLFFRLCLIIIKFERKCETKKIERKN